jgi:hypothetical protein
MGILRLIWRLDSIQQEYNIVPNGSDFMPLKTQQLSEDQVYLQKGVDIWLIRDNLKLSFEERISQHQNTLDFVDELKQIGRKDRAKSSSSSETINS